MSTYSPWYQLYAANIAGTLANNGNWASAISSRLIPSSNFEGTENQDRLVEVFDASFQNTKENKIILMLLMVAPSRTPDSDSSITPVWRKATWHVIMLTSWDPANTTTAAINAAFKAVHEAMDPLRKLTPSGAAYMNEADVFETDAAGSFWGQENYKRLLKIKKEMDPNRVLQVHRGIGWNPKAEIFECYPKSPNTFSSSQEEL